MPINESKQPNINKGGDPKEIKDWIDESYMKDSRKDQLSEMIKQMKLTKMFPIWSESLKKEKLSNKDIHPTVGKAAPALIAPLLGGIARAGVGAGVAGGGGMTAGNLGRMAAAGTMMNIGSGSGNDSNDGLHLQMAVKKNQEDNNSMPPQDGPSLPEEVPQPKTPKKNNRYVGGAMTESGQRLTDRYDPPLPEFQPLPKLPQGGRGIHPEASLIMLNDRTKMNIGDPKLGNKFLSAIKNVSQTIPASHINLLNGINYREGYLGSGQTMEYNHGSSTANISTKTPDISGTLKAAIGHAVWNHALDDRVRNAVKAYWMKIHSESGRQSEQSKRHFGTVQYGDYSGEEQYFVNNYQKFHASPELRRHLEATNNPMYRLMAAIHNVVPKLRDRNKIKKI